ncbi:MAG: hypothetical protein QXE51_04130 [Nitrososphaeria archaeon]
MISYEDRKILRNLAKRVVEIAELPIMMERIAMWKKHNQLRRVRPLILVFPEGAWKELLPQETLKCQGDYARQIEWELRRRIYQYENIHDDSVIEKKWVVSKIIKNTGWGLEAKYKPSSQNMGAWGFDPVIKDYADLKKLRFPEVIYDEKKSIYRLQEAQEIFGDILDVQFKGMSHISFHLMAIYSQLRGLEQVMLDMYENPGMLHDAIAFLEEGHRRLIEQYIDLNLLSLNNDDTYHSSGGVGYTDELPKSGFNPDRVCPCDMWASAESQEMAHVSPEQHYEFVMQYEKRLLEFFGLNGYGCCEDLTNKLDYVFTIPNLRRISISPWANVDRCAEKLGNRYIFSWKPNPSYLVGNFDTEVIKKYIKHTLDVTKNCVIEIILKDTHTCEKHPERFTQWTDIVQELVREY